MSAIPHSVIAESYCWPFSATNIAAFLNHFYETRSLTPRQIEEIWSDQLEINVPMRELGERPPEGFARSDEVRLVARLLAADRPVADNRRQQARVA